MTAFINQDYRQVLKNLDVHSCFSSPQLSVQYVASKFRQTHGFQCCNLLLCLFFMEIDVMELESKTNQLLKNWTAMK
ncbi:hypothetical protein VIGAN_09119200, partial [Vigna angularis var. angularis]